ncbi:MAG TPA: transporter substrate-binding domain-containing protein [Xanthobacteraceae bacterium]|jgi:polar amino acid transport system substrate-binding protein
MTGRSVAAALTVLWLAQAHAQAETVRITHVEPFPPLAELKDGRSQGLAVDIVRAAAVRAGIEVEFVGLPLEQLRPSLKDARADAIFLGLAPENRPLFDFSDPVLTTAGAFYVRAPALEPESAAALAGKTVVTPRAGPLAEYLRTNAPAVNVVLTTDYEESLTRVLRGEAVAAALNYHVGTVLAARRFPGQFTVPRRMFREIPQAVGVPKGERAAFLSGLNAGLAAIRADGTWQQINTRWMGQ